MKTLALFRHAKPEAQSSTGRDFDRALTDRGRDDAARIGAELRALGLNLGLVLASPARRAVETVERAGLREARLEDRIYNASTVELLDIVRSAPDGSDRLILVGHNPGFEQLASGLVGDEVEMPAGSLIEIELPIGRWRDVEEGGGRLARFLKPEDLA